MLNRLPKLHLKVVFYYFCFDQKNEFFSHQDKLIHNNNILFVKSEVYVLLRELTAKRIKNQDEYL
ncbi:hypothetical protein AB669_07750 [Pedobacter sp. BMA]|nr:hypothetical protein AB669_07750 [Pedobacter sp. BMA]